MQKPDLQHLLPWVLAGIAALCASWFLVRLLSLWLAPPAGDYPQLEPQRQQLAVSTFTGAWFGDSPAGGAVANTAVPAKDLPQARIDAELLGVVLSGQNAVANIAHGKKRDGVYRVGDELTRNVSVEAIEPHRVVIREQGQLRQIDLQALGGSPVKRTPRNSESARPEPSAAVALASGVEVAAGFSTVTLPTGQLGLQMSADTFTRLARYGLQSGEVVTDVNGMGVEQLMADRAQLGSLMQLDSVEVTLYRDGRSRQIRVQPSVVASSFFTNGSGRQ